MEVPYIEAHYEGFLSRQGEPGFFPFFHFGEFEAGAHADGPVTQDDFERGQRRLTERLLDRAGVPDGAAVLEVGCGFGGNVAFIAATRDARRIVGVDVGPRQLQLAARLRSPRPSLALAWVRGDAVALPFANGSFERIFAVECAFHFSSRRRFAAEAARVLATGGRLALTDIVSRDAADGPWPDALRPMAEVLRAEMGPFPDPFGDEGTWAAIAAAAGLDVVVRDDITAAVMPSFTFMLPDGKRHPSQHADRNSRSAAALYVTMAAGCVRMERWVLERR